MKILKALVFTPIMILISCDPIWFVSINGNKNLILKQEIGCHVKLVVENSHGSRFSFIFLNKKSFIKVENIKEFIELIETHNKDFEYFIPSERDADTITVDDRGWSLFTGNLKDPDKRNKDIEFIIPPNNYILCNDSPVISDTLKVILNVGKMKVGPRIY